MFMGWPSPLKKWNLFIGSNVSNAPTVQGMGEYTWSLFYLASVCWASEIEVVCSLAFAKGLTARAHHFIVCTSLCCQSSSLAVLPWIKWIMIPASDIVRSNLLAICSQPVIALQSISIKWTRGIYAKKKTGTFIVGLCEFILGYLYLSQYLRFLFNNTNRFSGMDYELVPTCIRSTQWGSIRDRGRVL